MRFSVTKQSASTKGNPLKGQVPLRFPFDFAISIADGPTIPLMDDNDDNTVPEADGEMLPISRADWKDPIAEVGKDKG